LGGLALGGREDPLPDDKLSLDAIGPMDDRSTEAESGLEVAQEAVEHGMRDKEHEPEGGDGDWMVEEIVVGVPIFGQLIESFILDAPPFMAENDDMARGDLILRQCGNPDPFRCHGGGDAGPVADRFGFKASDNADAVGVGVPGGEVGFVPALVGDLVFPEGERGRSAEHGACIFKQIPTLILEDHQRMFIVAAQEFEKPGGRELRLAPVIPQPLQALHQAERLLAISQRTRQHGSDITRFKAFPRLLADLIKELAGHLILLSPTPDFGFHPLG